MPKRVSVIEVFFLLLICLKNNDTFYKKLFLVNPTKSNIKTERMIYQVVICVHPIFRVLLSVKLFLK